MDFLNIKKLNELNQRVIDLTNQLTNSKSENEILLQTLDDLKKSIEAKNAKIQELENAPNTALELFISEFVSLVIQNKDNKIVYDNYPYLKKISDKAYGLSNYYYQLKVNFCTSKNRSDLSKITYYQDLFRQLADNSAIESFKITDFSTDMSWKNVNVRLFISVSSQFVINDLKLALFRLIPELTGINTSLVDIKVFSNMIIINWFENEQLLRLERL